MSRFESLCETMPPTIASPSIPTKAAHVSVEDRPSSGLTSEQARTKLTKYGPNAMPDTAIRPWRMALAKFWAPVPWMLEAAVILQLVLHEYIEAAVIAGLLVFNAALGFFQESRAQATLAALKSRLALTASVQRDGAWKTVPATEVVAGDVVKLSLGAVVAADVKLTAVKFCSISPCSPVNLYLSRPARGFRPTQGRWFGAARRRRRAQRPARAANSVARL